MEWPITLTHSPHFLTHPSIFDPPILLASSSPAMCCCSPRPPLTFPSPILRKCHAPTTDYLSRYFLKSMHSHHHEIASHRFSKQNPIQHADVTGSRTAWLVSPGPLRIAPPKAFCECLSLLLRGTELQLPARFNTKACLRNNDTAFACNTIFSVLFFSFLFFSFLFFSFLFLSCLFSF